MIHKSEQAEGIEWILSFFDYTNPEKRENIDSSHNIKCWLTGLHAVARKSKLFLRLYTCSLWTSIITGSGC